MQLFKLNIHLTNATAERIRTYCHMQTIFTYRSHALHSCNWQYQYAYTRLSAKPTPCTWRHERLHSKIAPYRV